VLCSIDHSSVFPSQIKTASLVIRHRSPSEDEQFCLPVGNYAYMRTRQIALKSQVVSI
jgi:hypothetical protein